jgi:hypothetical protein
MSDVAGATLPTHFGFFVATVVVVVVVVLRGRHSAKVAAPINQSADIVLIQ